MARLGGVGGRGFPSRLSAYFRGRLCCQPLQNFFAQLLSLSESLLVLDKDPIQFQCLVGRQFAPKKHVPHVDRVWQGRLFGQFFKGG